METLPAQTEGESDGKARKRGEASAPEVKGLRDENDRLKHALAETVLENPLLKKRAGLRLGRRYVRLQAAEKREVIRLVEGSDL